MTVRVSRPQSVDAVYNDANKITVRDGCLVVIWGQPQDGHILVDVLSDYVLAVHAPGDWLSAEVEQESA